MPQDPRSRAATGSELPPAHDPGAGSRYTALLARRAQLSASSQAQPHPLGTGCQAPFAITVGGALATQSGAAHVATCIRLILGTRPGERRMRPDFGCALHDFFFAPNTPQTRYRIQKAVEVALETLEPRIEDLEVQVLPDPQALERVQIQVKYRLRGSAWVSAQRFAFELKE